MLGTVEGDGREGLDEMIERVTVDAYGDEGSSSFLQAFADEVEWPVEARVVGVPVRVVAED